MMKKCQWCLGDESIPCDHCGGRGVKIENYDFNSDPFDGMDLEDDEFLRQIMEEG